MDRFNCPDELVAAEEELEEARCASEQLEEETAEVFQVEMSNLAFWHCAVSKVNHYNALCN